MAEQRVIPIARRDTGMTNVATKEQVRDMVLLFVEDRSSQAGIIYTPEIIEAACKAAGSGDMAGVIDRLVVFFTKYERQVLAGI
jgi:hypothetical protein